MEWGVIIAAVSVGTGLLVQAGAAIYACGILRQEIRSMNDRLDSGSTRMSRIEQRLDSLTNTLLRER